MTSESRLISAAQQGSTDAFTELVRGYRERLLRFLLTRCRSRADAEDALQDTLVNAFRYIGSYDARWRFSTWLYRIAIRKAASLALSPLPVAGVPEVADDDPLDHCIAQSDRENLWRSAKRLLSDEVFTAMWLRYVEDMSVSDIAAALDRSSSWTKVNLHRGRRVLAAELNDEADTAGSKAYG